MKRGRFPGHTTVDLILLGLRDKPNTSWALAGLVGRSISSVQKHLNTMRDDGLVHPIAGPRTVPPSPMVWALGPDPRADGGPSTAALGRLLKRTVRRVGPDAWTRGRAKRDPLVAALFGAA